MTASHTRSPHNKKSAKSNDDGRKIKKSTYKSFRLHKKIHPVTYALPSSLTLFMQSVRSIKLHWKLLLGITALYGVLTILLVRTVGDNSGLDDLKNLLNESLDGITGQAIAGVSLFVYLLGSSGNSVDSGANAYQFFILLTVSLALIWALRQTYALSIEKVQKIRVRDAFYRGMYPLVPFLLVLLVLVIELVPAALGSYVYSTVVEKGIAVEQIEKILWLLFFAMSFVLSIYLVISTMFALYVVALPDMSPLRALRSARGLVKYRRWAVIRRILLLVLFLLVSAGAIMVPLILFATAAAEWVFFVLSIVGFTVIHGFMYALYRELLNE